MNTKVHITLVGGQIIPLFQGIIQYPADEVILVHTTDTLRQAKILEEHINNKVTLLQIKDAFDFEVIYASLQNFTGLDKKYFINITGGTKIMSIALLECFIKFDNATVFYIDQNQKVLDIRTRKSFTSKVEIDIATVFSLSGNKLFEYTDYQNIDHQELEDARAVRSMIKYAKGEWYKLMEALRVDSSLKGMKTLGGSFYAFNKVTEQLTVSLQRADKFQRYTWKSRNAVRFVKDTQWFEIEVAEMLSKWRFCKMLYVQSKVAYQSGQEKNEIDIIIHTGSKLIFVECKTQVFDIKDIDKFRNVVKNYGGLAAKAILITDQPLNLRVAEKCRDNNISHFCLKGVPGNASFLKTDELLYYFLEGNLDKNNPV